ncbi:MAG TPA: LamG domain-containing protein, partial [Solirubrobacterales bacterium]|nr:LamG domain-containing protein [Solirubrobacterales bacterium]
IEGATWFDNGRYGKALSFDGADDCVTVADSPELQLTEEFTLQAWVKPRGEVKSDPIIFKETEGLFSYSLGLGLASSGKVEAYIGEEEEGHTLVVSPEPLAANVWAHVAVTYDGSHMRLYLDGELIDTNPTAVANMPSSGPLQIGCADIFNEHFQGLIDEPRLYNRALGAGELQQTMTTGFPIAITEAATEVEANDAILNGIANANGGATEYFFEYGPSKAYGTTIAGEELGSKREAVEITEAVVDLAPETTYHYRLVSNNAAGTVYGRDKLITTVKRTLSLAEEAELKNAADTLGLTPSEEVAGPNDFYGMMWTGDLKKMREQSIYEAVERSGAKMHHIGISPYADQVEIDRAFKAAAKSDITVLPGLGGGPYPKPGTPARAKWLQYAKDMVQAYGPGSSFSHPAKAWVIWNEPNMSHLDKVTNSNEEEGAVNPEGFAEFFKEMSEALRSASKGKIQILTPGFYGYRVGGCHPQCHLTPRVFLKRMDEQLKALSYSNAYDGMALHPYVFKIGERGRQHAPRDEADVKQLSIAIRRVIAGVHKLHPDKPLWITEIGFPVANPGNKAKVPPVTNHIQRLLVQATFSMMQNYRIHLNIPHAFYYNIQDDAKAGWEYHSGLLTLKGNARPAWSPYSELAGGKPCPHAPC